MAWRENATCETADAGYNLVSVDEYWQAVGFEKIPSLYINGEPVSWRENLICFKVKETVEEWHGITQAKAVTLGTSSTVYTHTPGTESFESRSVKISRRKANAANGWNVTRSTRQTALYVNGKRICGEEI